MSSSAATAYTTLVGVRTRAQKRRIGERDVWDLIVNNDDICFKHILPRLNRTDVKFLYEVNTEKRALIKRSTRANDLERRFNIGEMSSISTLEFAWEHKSLCTGAGVWYETYFCYKVAQTNKLELLKWAREEKKCDWGVGTIHAAAYRIRIRTRIGIIARVLKLPRPCTILKRERETHKHRHFSLHYISLLPRHIIHTHT